MSWKMKGDPKMRRLTKSLAEEFAGMTPAPHDRPLNPTRCSILKTAFDHETFRTCEWARVYCHETKQTYRINGKHTSTVLASYNGTFPKDLSVVIEEYEADTLQDVANLYSTFDTKSQARSTGDINHVYAASIPELNEVSNKIIDLAVTGLAYVKYAEDYTKQPINDRAALMVDHVPFILWLSGLFNNLDQKKTQHIRRMAVVAAMIKTYTKSKTASTEFWTAVRDETGPKPDCADRKLAKLLITTRLRSRFIDSTASKKLSVREMHSKCIHAWNAWREGETTSMAYFPKAKVPTAK